MNKDPNFASEDLGLAPVNDDLEGDNFDAFNDDTFGAEEVWHEDAHEEVTGGYLDPNTSSINRTHKIPFWCGLP